MTDRPSRHVQVSPASERPPAADEPNDAQRRMLRVCQAALAAIEAHDEYEDGDNAIVFISEHGARGISIHNYDNENDSDLAAADFFEHLRSMVADAGIDVQLIDEHGRRVDADDYQQQCEDDRQRELDVAARIAQALWRCAYKLKVEYDRQQPDAAGSDECWAEAEAAWALLRELGNKAPWTHA